MKDHVTETQMNIFENFSKPIIMSNVHRHTTCHVGTVDYVTRGFHEAGFLKRVDSKDKRSQLYVWTDKGEKLYKAYHILCNLTKGLDINSNNTKKKKAMVLERKRIADIKFQEERNITQ